MMFMSETMRCYEDRIRQAQEDYQEATRRDNVLMMKEALDRLTFLHTLKAGQAIKEAEQNKEL